ncbi:MAG: hypothetical protein HY052_04530 [Proteobacteria bacterium]|nr:hypothetical protein [Pseudomonadota bacterium]
MTKPSVAQVVAAYEQELKKVETAVADSIESIFVKHTKTTGDLDTAKLSKLAVEEATKKEAINTSQQSVAEKAAALKEAMKAADAAAAALQIAKQSHRQTTRSVKQSFNQAAKNIKAEIEAQKKAATQAREEALAAEKAKVAAIRAAKRHAALATTIAVVKYDAFVVKDTTVRIANGTVAVGKALTSAFNTGFNSDTGLKEPEFNIQLPTVQAPAEVKTPDSPQP